jgi:hypothetical protein
MMIIKLALALALSGPEVSRAELLLLLEIGVSEQDIVAFADVRGGFESIDSETRSAAESLGASAAFLDRLPRSAPDFGSISELAKRSDVFEDEALGLAFVYPAGWAVSREGSDSGRGTVVLRVAPRSTPAPKAFVTPCLFVFVQNDSGLVPESTPAALGEVRRAVLGRLRGAGLRPTASDAERTSFLGQPCDAFVLEAPVDGGDLGVLGLALTVDAQGRAAGVGFTAGAGDRAATLAAFREMSRSVVLR